MEENKKIIISLGGSIVVPDLPDPEYLKNFISLTKDYLSKNIQFFIIVGGGKTCRNYQNALRSIRDVTNEELDYLGISATLFNAEFVRASFGDIAHNVVIQNPKDLVNSKSMVTIGAGWKPGCSTDYDAILYAEQVGAKSVINLSNILYAYDKDPKKYEDAKPIIESNWQEFRKILPVGWNPGANTPFDPIAAEKAEDLGIEVVIMGGTNLENLKNYLDGKEFIGTRIK